MPELPEVETIRRAMEAVSGQKLIHWELRRPDMIRQQDFMPQELENQICMQVSRRGKYLSFVFPDNRFCTIHLGMSGRLWRSRDEQEKSLKHVHLIAEWENGEFVLFYDPRRFGGIWFTQGLPPTVQKLGKEPLDADFDAHELWEKSQKRTLAIKLLLLNQQFIAGLGNIYADESLYAAGIHPLRVAQSLSLEEWKRLAENMTAVLRASLENKGTTFRDYRDGLNQKGAFQDFLQVYGQAGQPCPGCGTTLEMLRIGGRSSCFCPQCQK